MRTLSKRKKITSPMMTTMLNGFANFINLSDFIGILVAIEYNY
jgi:hypothetical protein